MPLTTKKFFNSPEDVADIKAAVQWRNPVVAWIMTAAALVFALASVGLSRFSMSGATRWFEIPDLEIPARLTGLFLALGAALLAALITSLAIQRKRISGLLMALVGLCFIINFMAWVVCGRPDSVIPVIPLMAGSLVLAVPLTMGAMSGLVCERSGIINIAIEGQLLAGAFVAAVGASITSSALFGLFAAPFAGVIVGAILALFTIKYRCDHIIVGVVLNMLVIGVTSFLYSSWLTHDPLNLNRAMQLPTLPIPFLVDIPFIGPLLFKQSILVYLVYVIVVALSLLLYRSKWGLRTRACGEHPRAADTVGIRVNRLRWRNTLLGGALAGFGGAYLTIGADLAFTKDMAAGNGFIALAAMILGKWNPKGAVGAAILFGFATKLGYVMQATGTAIPHQFLLMTPYVVTILAVAGFVGSVRPPAAEGKPYP